MCTFLDVLIIYICLHSMPEGYMTVFFLRRLLVLLPTVVGLTLLTFFLIRLVPGDPVEVIMGERVLDPQMHAQALHRLGLDQPLFQQYVDYLGQLLKGDLGLSFISQVSVWQEFKTLFPATLELTVSAMVLATVVGVLLGTLAAVKRGTWLDYSLMTAALTGFSMPVFWWGLLLIMLLSGPEGLGLPVSGAVDLKYDIQSVTGLSLIDALMAEWAEPELNQGVVLSAVKHLLLPTIVLATIPLAVIARMTRSAVLEVLREDYIRAAKARGLSSLRVVLIHALRNALIPVLTILGLQVGALLGGAVLTETIFSWPGIGKWLIDAIFRRDYPIVQNGILLVALLVILMNFIVDLLYSIANPRMRRIK